MTVEFLIHAIVHQTTILIAQLATLGGGRAPLAQVANQVFLDLVRELDRQGVSRKVSADMFGLGLRTYRRKIQRMSESSTERGRSLWEVVLEFIKSRATVGRNDILLRFVLDDEAQVRAVLRDLCDSQLVIAEERAGKTCYRAASDEELLALRNAQRRDSAQASEGYEDLLVALIYREGALTLAEIAQRAQTEERLLETPIARLLEASRIQRTQVEGEVRYEARALVIPLGAVAGWEAAVFDHFKAMVKTVLSRASQGETSHLDASVGGSTYTIEVWPGHPLEAEVSGALREIRTKMSELRQRVATHNLTEPRPDQYRRVVIYAGQSVSEEGHD